MSLFRRIFLLNAAGLTVATALLLGPVTVSTPILPGEALVVVLGLALMLVVNGFVLWIGLAPLQRLGRAMAAADLTHPGARAPVTGPAEVAELITTYNTMLDRLETERATSSARALSAQEGERRRVSQELHDEVGQTLTAVLLQLKRVADRVPGELRDEVSQTQEAVRGSLDEIRRIARRLRPGVLEELGLHSALRSLTGEFTTHGLSVAHHLDADLPPLNEEAELVVYRVAQEGLTNTARHAGADRAELRLRRVPDGVELLVRDNGRGPGRVREGAGITGMRERALLVGAAFSLGPGPGRGTDVRLRLTTAGGSLRQLPATTSTGTGTPTDAGTPGGAAPRTGPVTATAGAAAPAPAPTDTPTVSEGDR
ncbi:HAMP domain-containing sensor histidine kinase [Streptomyces sp. NPDC004528]|uniref:sensor histidine kinase n=1 Tax=Streptomyces sp. NPDC004528 TaxID=3154550 RepID=UPI0033A2F831